MSESRTDILTWINNLLQLNVTKIEHLGTGAVYCQIIDSIYGDVPLSKVKFNANQEFQYVQNFKVLQTAFLKHQIPNAVPVERLIKLKFQDNMEFSQWLKKFWDQNFHNHDGYDALGRRGGSVMMASPNGIDANSTVGTLSRPVATDAASLRPICKAPLKRDSDSRAMASPKDAELVVRLKTALAELKDSSVKMQEERDFYFDKLRQVELALQAELGGLDRDGLVAKIQEILYAPMN